MRAKILIEVSGGVVQRVASDRRLDVYLIDHDNLKAGASPEKTSEPYAAEIIPSMDEEVKKQLSTYQKR
jgi:hypothetical protein